MDFRDHFEPFTGGAFRLSGDGRAIRVSSGDPAARSVRGRMSPPIVIEESQVFEGPVSEYIVVESQIGNNLTQGQTSILSSIWLR